MRKATESRAMTFTQPRLHPSDQKSVILRAKTDVKAYLNGYPKAGMCPFWDAARSTLWRTEFDKALKDGK